MVTYCNKKKIKLICVFVFAYAKSRFSLNEAHSMVTYCKKINQKQNERTQKEMSPATLVAEKRALCNLWSGVMEWSLGVEP